MAITVSSYTDSNPNVLDVGTSNAELTIIRSGQRAVSTVSVTYQIARRDGQEISEAGGQHITISSGNTTLISRLGDIVECTTTYLIIRLDYRTKYKVRIEVLGRTGYSGWSSWVNFKTRDKKYTTPDAITQEDIPDETEPRTLLYPHKKVKKGIRVTNTAKATVTRTSRGATVVNTDLGYVGTSSIRATARGATVRNVSYYPNGLV